MHPNRLAVTSKIILIVLALSTVVLTSAGSCGPTGGSNPGGTQAPTTGQQQPGPTDNDDGGSTGGNRTPGGDTGSDGQGG